MTLERAEYGIEENLTTAAELQATIDSLYVFARDSQTVLGGPRVFQVWGRNGNKTDEKKG